jgi:Ca2+/Na+ antiporter
MPETRPAEPTPSPVPQAAPAPAPGPQPPVPGPALTWRSIGLSLLLMPVNAYWLVQMERIRYSAHPTTVSLFFNAVFILLVVTLLNALVGHWRPRWAMRRGELYVVYVSMSLASTLPAHDLQQILVPMLMWPYLYHDRSGWSRWIPDLPRDWMVSDQRVYNGYFQGNDTLYRPEYLQAWAVPVLMWTLFLAALLLVMLCVNVLLRKQWTDRERLSYPIVQLPLEIAAVGEGGRLPPLFRNRLFWIGFAAAGFVDLVNSLNLYYPSIPTILTPGRGASFLDLLQFFQSKPLNAIGWTPISWYPFLIGLGMLMPVDFLFSAWFFYLFWKAQLVVTAMMAWDQDPQFPYPNAQAFGAYMAFFVYTFWLSRGYLAQVVARIFGGRSDIDDRNEPLTYRQAALGIVVGLAVLVWFSVRLGMPAWLAVVFFAIYFALALAITRMRAELGTPIHDLHFTGPDWTLAQVIGTRDLGPKTLNAFTMYFWFNRAYRGHPMPHQLEGFKMAEQNGGEYRKWFWWMLLVGVLGSVVGFWAMLHLNYEYGALAKSSGTFGDEAYNRLTGWLANPRPPNQTVMAATAVGFAFALFLQFMRIRFPWWPFHPLGYAVTSSWQINLVWMPLFIAWVLKLVILRYSGLPGYRRSLPFFFGLMLGQFVIGSLLNIYGILMQVPTYQFYQ